MYCPSCGAKTFEYTGKSDCEAGDKYACFSCGAQFWMTEAEPLQPAAREDPKYVYDPVRSLTEVIQEQMLERWAMDLLQYCEPSAISMSDGSGIIKFRKYKQPPTEAQTNTNKEY